MGTRHQAEIDNQSQPIGNSIPEAAKHRGSANATQANY
jgi:hypothetical protein